MSPVSPILNRFNATPLRKLAFALAWILCILAIVTPQTSPAAAADGDSRTLREALRARRQPPPSSELPTPPIAAPGDRRFTLRHQGAKRHYRLHVPKGHDFKDARPSPLVMAFHGGGGNMDIKADDRYYGLTTQSERSAYVLVFPNGCSPLSAGKLATWNAGACCGQAQEKNVDDVAFVRAVLADVAKRVDMDEARIFATGMSNRGMFSYRLACEMADIFKAIAAVAGTDVAGPACDPSGPVSILHIHAKGDDHVPFDGGMGSASPTRTNLTSVGATVSKWVALNACQATPLTVLKAPGATCETYPACRGASKVRLCVTDRGGHSWPGAAKPRTGQAGSTALSANQVIWAFFDARE